MSKQFSIVMFAYNEEKNITKSVTSVFENVDERFSVLHVIANGCSDGTVDVLNGLTKQFPKLNVIELELGDKCNAWNHYVHNVANDDQVHFFVDADVQFSPQVFPKLYGTLSEHPTANAVASLPFSGRNKEFYQSLVTERSCLFGNCYGLSGKFVQLVKDKQFYLPIGLCWIDSSITKAVNSDIGDQSFNLPDRVTYNLECGYTFTSLNPLKKDDRQLYFSRIARYAAGKLQEGYLKDIELKDWPRSLNAINSKVVKDIISGESKVKLYLRSRILRRLKKALPEG